MTEEYGSNNSSITTFDLDVMGMIRRRFKHVVLGVVLGTAAGLAYFFLTTPLYESELEILVGQRSSELTSRGTADDGYASGSTIQEDVLATHLDILTSKRVLEDAVAAAKLDELYSFKQARQNSISPVQHILNGLTVARGGDGPVADANVLTAKFRDPRASDAKKVLDALYASYNGYIKKQWRNHSQEAADLIQKAQDTHEKELAAADKEYREFMQSVPVLMDGNQMNDIHRDRLAKLETELGEVRSSIAEARSRSVVISGYMDQISGSDMTDIDRLALLSENEVQRLKLFMEMTRGDFHDPEFQASQPLRAETAKAQFNRLMDLYQQQRKLSEDYGPNHPTVQATMQEIEVIKEFIAKHAPENTFKEVPAKMSATEMLDAYRSLLQHDVSALALREKALLQSTKQELEFAKMAEADFMKAESLKAKKERALARYEEVVERLNEINLAGNFAGFSTDLLATPAPASDPCWPKLPLALAVGLLLGGLFGITTALMAELADSTFRDAKDLEQTLNAPILTHVSPFEMRKLRQLVEEDSRVAPQVCAFHGPRSQESEVYRTARTSLLLNCKKLDHRVIMMSSPAPGDGKSTTIGNLAVSLSQTGKRVLLIDADLRRPMVYNLFGGKSNPGLADVVEQQVALKDAVQPSEQENLDLLTHGTRTGSPSEMLESYHFGAMLEEARRLYDLVLIDAPPLLAVTDPAIIATLADAVVLTVQIQKNGRRPVQRAREILDDVNVTPVGIIVNNSDEKAKGYGYSHDYYGDAYGYVGKYYDDYSAPDAPVRTRKNREAVIHS